MKGYWAILVITLGIVLFSITAYAQSSAIPDWVKNNAKWWAEGQIGESDFIGAIQYLINQGIITIPITNVVAAGGSLSDNDRAMSIVVHYDGAIFGAGETIYTYSEFHQVSKSIKTSTTGVQLIPGAPAPTFYLVGLPSKDKHTVYELVDEFVDLGTISSQYNIQVDILTGDGTILQSWNYRNCWLFEYAVYSESSKEIYRFSDKDDLEIREVISWGCSGYTLNFP